MARRSAGRQNVKSWSAGDAPADLHERRKDFLTMGELGRLLDAAKTGRHGVRDPKHTVRYTRIAGHRFEGLWRP